MTLFKSRSEAGQRLAERLARLKLVDAAVPRGGVPVAVKVGRTCDPLLPEDPTMMKTHWILVANASQARLFTRPSPTGPLTPLSIIRHVSSRHMSSTQDVPSLAPGDAKRAALEHFAREIVRYLQVVIGNFDTLSIFAPDPFLRELKKNLSAELCRTVQFAIDTDLCALSRSEIEQRLPKPRPIISLRHVHA